MCWQLIRRHQQVLMQSQKLWQLVSAAMYSRRCIYCPTPRCQHKHKKQHLKSSEFIYEHIFMKIFSVHYFPSVPHTLCSVASVPICCSDSVKVNWITALICHLNSTQTCLFLGRCSVKMKVSVMLKKNKNMSSKTYFFQLWLVWDCLKGHLFLVLYIFFFFPSSFNNAAVGPHAYCSNVCISLSCLSWRHWYC